MRAFAAGLAGQRARAFLRTLPWLLIAASSAIAGPGGQPFAADQIAAGRAQYDRTCAQCHGRNMVNAGTTVYDLRRFPQDDLARFVASVTNGKNNMPSFKDASAPEQLDLLWAFVASRGGKEP